MWLNKEDNDYDDNDDEYGMDMHGPHHQRDPEGNSIAYDMFILDRAIVKIPHVCW